ncbi:MAG: hypothetical protein C4525_17140 [Desulfarculus sp.]|nr:MAG: hypothetical protein C4525_17140 [Desulfarculus sp.]
MSPAHAQPGRGQNLVGAAVLLVLALVAAGVYWQQLQYDPAQWGRLGATSGQTAGPLAAFSVPGLSPLDAGQSFGPDNLSDKIDGKAELYLAAGFESLHTRRYALAGQSAAWLEVFLYRMKSAEAAYSVFSSQRRSGAEALTITQQSYRTSNAVYLANGPDYLEVVASAATPGLQKAVLDAAQAYAQARGVKKTGAASEAGLFPPQGLQANSVVLLSKDAFGMAGLDRVYIATYPQGSQELMAFLARRADPSQARTAAQGYVQFLLGNGGQESPPPAELPGGRLVEIMGTWDLVFSQGPFLAGVRGGEDQAATLALARLLRARLSEVKP